MLNGRYFRLTAIIFQSFAAFVGLSILLGRMYSLTYFETLGIIPSTIDINVIGYSIVSPDVTIAGIGTVIAVSSLVMYWLRGLGSPLDLDQQTWDVGRLALGLVLVAFAILIHIVASFSSITMLAPRGSIGILLTLRIFLSLYGGVVLATSMPTTKMDSKTAFSDENARNDVSETLGLLHKKKELLELALGAWIALLIIINAIGLFTYAGWLGRVDAKQAIIHAPQASIEFITSREPATSDAMNCSPESSNCNAGIVYISDSFVYVRIEQHPSLGDYRLYALPVGSIASINYAHKID